MTDDQIKAFMALAMQNARDAISMTTPRSDVLEAALSSLDIVLGFEAEHWQENACLRAALPRS